jgi:hypothetical protein
MAIAPDSIDFEMSDHVDRLELAQGGLGLESMASSTSASRDVFTKNIERGIVYSIEDLKSSLVIPCVHSESACDVIGVLINGLKMKLLNFKGDISQVFIL